uniref:Uncharacterized protein n=1 Tax=viral metagenome TaxID=1070528 RepID=A0A6H2A100_9ZZZZ
MREFILQLNANVHGGVRDKIISGIKAAYSDNFFIRTKGEFVRPALYSPLGYRATIVSNHYPTIRIANPQKGDGI